MVELRHAGWTLAEVGEEYGVTRERVRQLTTDHVDLETIRVARAGQSRLAAEEDHEAIMKAWHVGETARGIATRRGLDTAEVVRVIDTRATELERRLRRGRQLHRPAGRRAWVEWLQLFADAHDGQTPGTTAFRHWRADAPEPSGVSAYFDSWREACEAAGLIPNRARRTDYTRRWTAEDCLVHVRRCGDVIGRIPSYVAYQEWARVTEGAPSASLVRMRLGAWNGVLRAVYEVER